MMTEEQLDNWFSHHSPTEETAPKYAAIRAAEEVARHRIVQIGPVLAAEIDALLAEYGRTLAGES